MGSRGLFFFSFSFARADVEIMCFRGLEQFWGDQASIGRSSSRSTAGLLKSEIPLALTRSSPGRVSMVLADDG